MDLIGPLPETPRGNKYIATLTGYFSKWAEAAPFQNKSALGVAKFIYSVSELCMTVHIRTFISCTESLACMDIITDHVTDVFCIYRSYVGWVVLRHLSQTKVVSL